MAIYTGDSFDLTFGLTLLYETSREGKINLRDAKREGECLS